MDLFSIFWSGIITDDNFIGLDLNEIRWNYVKSWFLVDIVALLPFDYISLVLYSLSSLHAPDVFNTLRPIVKICSLVKLLRVLKFMRLLTRWKEVYTIILLSAIVCIEFRPC